MWQASIQSTRSGATICDPGIDSRPTSTPVGQAGENKLVASGPLTIKGYSQHVELPITPLGKQKIPEQMQQMLGGTKEVASFQASTAVDRGDFGVGVGNWAATMVAGGEVNIEIVLEAHNG